MLGNVVFFIGIVVSSFLFSCLEMNDSRRGGDEKSSSSETYFFVDTTFSNGNFVRIFGADSTIYCEWGKSDDTTRQAFSEFLPSDRGLRIQLDFPINWETEDFVAIGQKYGLLENAEILLSFEKRSTRYISNPIAYDSTHTLVCYFKSKGEESVLVLEDLSTNQTKEVCRKIIKGSAVHRENIQDVRFTNDLLIVEWSTIDKPCEEELP